MRISNFIAKVEDKVIARAPAAKSLARDAANSTRLGLGLGLEAIARGATKLAAKAAPTSVRTHQYQAHKQD